MHSLDCRTNHPFSEGVLNMAKELVIISGKGGTGKTSMAASFSALAGNAVMADCDVDASNLHLVLGHRLLETGDFKGMAKAAIDRDACDECGMCIEYCRFDAISTGFSVDPLACEGCGVCGYICPRKAVTMIDHVSGRWYVSQTRHGIMVHASLGIAEGNSGKLVTHIRRKAVEVAGRTNAGLIIVDGSPGTGCPVIASITGASLVLIVTEPTIAGIHDLQRVYALARHFRAETAVCVNKSDINPGKSAEAEKFCHANGIFFAGYVPYDRDITEAQRAGVTVVEHSTGAAAMAIREVWNYIFGLLG